MIRAAMSAGCETGWITAPKIGSIGMIRVISEVTVRIVIPTLSGAMGRDLLFLSTLHTVAERENADSLANRRDMCADEDKRVSRCARDDEVGGCSEQDTPAVVQAEARCFHPGQRAQDLAIRDLAVRIASFLTARFSAGSRCR